MYAMKDRFRGYLPVVVDVETGGLEPHNSALLEIAMVTTAMDERGILFPDKRIEFAINPAEGTEVLDSALKFTGIVLDDERGAVDEGDALQACFKLVREALKAQDCKRAILVGHNAWFDLHFMQAAVARAGIKRDPFHPFSSFDTATLAGVFYGHTVLAKVCHLAGIDFDNAQAHSALYDTEKTAELFCTIVNASPFELVARNTPDK